jgi:phosphoadenosine phosphosulfate reductase
MTKTGQSHAEPPGRCVRDLAAAMGRAQLPGRLSLARSRIPGRIVFTTSFGLEDQALAHAICTARPSLDVEIVTLDTGRLFPETYDLWAATEERYGVRIPAYAPDRDRLEALVARQGINGLRDSVENRQACCGVRKVVPLGRALAGAAAWVTGLRAEQSRGRAATPFAAFDGTYGLVKVNPLADWSRQDLLQYVADNAISYNPLHDRGFPSIGCAPCTRAVRLGEPERAGRWWWENDAKKECGLHVPRSDASLALHDEGAAP